MNTNVLISIITVVRNGEDHLEETIKSVLSQTWKSFQYIIIDGKSTDRTIHIIKKYENQIDFWTSEEDTGIYDAMNKAIKQATGDWVIFLNAGDLFASTDVISDIFTTPIPSHIQVIYGQTVLKYTTTDTTIQRNDNIQKIYKRKGIVIINHQSTIIKREAFEKIGYYDLNLKFTADNYWLNCAIKYFGIKALQYVNIPIAIYDKTGISSNPKYHLKIIKEFIKICKKTNGSVLKQIQIAVIGYTKTIFYFLKNANLFR
ncbi:glycosyltransferase family 2 protein [Sunxiuqinia elliptica]|uniref:Glycosyl transferase family 2 n=1 Tax=Sunxiuqinia elliptica TaxID=655355 RepID=A0A1I2IXN3_9BACT|nr:glycosyltransferase family 2 protein [Sunxiuqinia elliptica]SFF46478.1 Glycosyl transferase family 2 [Sunxiuqinia elliptica]